MAVIVYSKRGGVTARALGERLGIRAIDEARLTAADGLGQKIIRWGATREGPGGLEEVNLRPAIRLASNKLLATHRMHEAGVPVPRTSCDLGNVGVPALGRSIHHMAGRDIRLIMQSADVRALGACDYYTKYIPTDAEFRIHVWNGRVFMRRRKVLQTPAAYVPYIRNYENGHVFVAVPNWRAEPCGEGIDRAAIDACRALGLHFAAVDVLRGEPNGEAQTVYVLECNTAPAAQGMTLDAYATLLTDWIG